MVTAVRLIDPCETGAWDEFVATHPEANVFHTSAWARLLCETYNYSPRYYVLSNSSGEIVAGIPAMLIKSKLTGKRLVGLPFSDLCPPLVRDPDEASLLLSGIKKEIDSDHLRYAELRGPSPLSPEQWGFQPSSNFLQHLVPLDKPLPELKARFHSSARRAIRKAEREGVSVRLSTNEDDLIRFYQLHTATRQKQGLVPQPWSFFQRLHSHFFSTDRGFLLMAEWQRRTIAADLLLRNNAQLFYKFNASDVRFLHLRPNNVLMWRAIQLGKELGCSVLDLGRCEVANEGLRTFKNLWAAEEQPLPYYYYPAVGGLSLVNQGGLKSRLLGTAVKLTPRSLLPHLGGLTYRHLG